MTPRGPALDLKAALPVLGATLPAALYYVAVVAPAGAALPGDVSLSPAWSHDLWLDMDNYRVFEAQSDPHSPHERSGVHPLFALFAGPPTQTLMALGLDAVHAAMTVQHAAALGSIVALVLLLRRLGHGFLEQSLGALLLATSGAMLFANVANETYAFGALSILLALLLTTGAPPANARSFAAHVAAGVASFGVTITNWGAALAGTLFASRRWTTRIAVGLATMILALALAQAQRLLAPSVAPPNWLLLRELGFMAGDKASLADRLASLLAYTQVVPPPVWQPGIDPLANILSDDTRGAFLTTVMSVSAAIERAGPLAALGWAAWAVLVSLGIAAAVRRGLRTPLVAATLLFLAFQVVLHSVYGETTFLYGLHVVPLLTLLGLETARVGGALWPWAARGLAAVTILAGIVVNPMGLRAAIAEIERVTPPLDEMRIARAERPNEVWPRGAGGVWLGGADWPLEERGLAEPGGGFSPAVGAFGLAVVTLSERDAPLRALPWTPLDETDHVLRETARGAAMTANTDLATVEIDPTEDGWSYRARLEPLRPGERVFALDVGSAGPAGGALGFIRALEGEGAFQVGPNWRLDITPAPARVLMGDESLARALGEGRQVESASGWARARFVAPSGAREIHARLTRLEATPQREPSALSALEAQAPPALEAVLTTQYILTGQALANGAVRVGDPLLHRSGDARTAAHAAVALASAGAMARAQETLAAELDDARESLSGAALLVWAADELRRRGADPAWLAARWPALERRMAFVARCTALEVEAAGRAVLAHGRSGCAPVFMGAPVTETARDRYAPGEGLAAAHLAFSAGAALAGALDHDADAAIWAAERDRLAALWRERLTSGFGGRLGFLAYATKFDPTQSDPSLLLAAALGVKETQETGLVDEHALAGLAAFPYALGHEEPELWREALSRAPEDEARAFVRHAAQRVHLGGDIDLSNLLAALEPFRVAPGLWQFARAEGGGLRLNDWAFLRGSELAHGATPDYFLAANLLQLLLDGLVVSSEDGVVRVGAGVPALWLREPLAAGPILTRVGPVCWAWDGAKLEVSAPVGVRVEAAGAFKGGPLRVVRRANCVAR